MDILVTILVVVLVAGGITAVVVARRRSQAANLTTGKKPGGGTTTTWQAVTTPLPPVPTTGTAKGPKVRVLSVNGVAPTAAKAKPGGQPWKFAPPTPPVPQQVKGGAKKAGTGANAHVTKVVNVPGLCPICGLVGHADGCPRKH